MNSPASLRHTVTIPRLQSLKPSKRRLLSNVKLPSRLFNRSCSEFLTVNSILRREFSTRNLRLTAIKASSNDAQSVAGGSFRDRGGVREPSFAEFITSERVKVVAMLALALALCNADRVVMSVAIVPLSASHGWRQSFAGVVQVLIIFTLTWYIFSVFVIGAVATVI